MVVGERWVQVGRAVLAGVVEERWWYVIGEVVAVESWLGIFVLQRRPYARPLMPKSPL